MVVRPDGRVLLAQRPAGKPYEGYWEFPGGKLEPGETPAHALARELSEELGLAVRRAAPWLVQEYVYPHAHVELNFFRVFEWDGEPHGHDGQAFAWQTPGAFDVAPLLPANTRIMQALLLPPVYGITCASDLGEEAFLVRASRAFDAGLKLVQLRERDWPADRVAAFAARLRDLAHAHGAKVLLNGEADAARRLGLDGVHWTSARLAAATSRPDDLVVGASCHDAAEIARAGGWVATSRCWDRCGTRRRTRARARSDGTDSRARSRARGCRCTRWAGSHPPISMPRSTTARTASRCAAARGRSSG